MLQAFQITLSDPRSGPRGGKAKRAVTCYTVTATTADEALQLFTLECPAQITPNTHVSVSACQCRVMLCR